MSARPGLSNPDAPAKPDVRLSRFFEQVMASWEAAAAAAGGATDCYFAAGGRIIRLCFAGSALVSAITPALQHLAAPSAAPDLTVFLRDSVSTGIPMPPPAWTWDAHIVRGELTGIADEEIAAAFDLGPGALSMLDRAGGRGLYWVRDAHQIPYFESAAPLRTILHWFMGLHGVQLTHAAAVGVEDGGVLLAGRGGSGKSTAAIVSLAAGLRYLGDDYVLLSCDPLSRAHSLYCTGKLEASQTRRLPALSHAVRNPERLAEEKAVYDFADHFRSDTARSFPIRAVLLPRVSGRRETTLSRASAADAMKALAPSTIFQLPGAGRRDFRALSAIVRKLPVYILNAGTDLSGIPEVIRRLLEENPSHV
jgi:hypothetical protein